MEQQVVRFKCAYCGEYLEAPLGSAAKTASCPGCRREILVPSPQPSEAAVPVAHAPVAAQPPPPSPQISDLAVTSLVLGIVGLMTGWACVGIPISVLAVVFGHMGCARIASQPKNLSGRGLAIAGLVTGYVGLVLSILAILVFGATVAAVLTLLGGFLAAVKHAGRPM